MFHKHIPAIFAALLSLSFGIQVPLVRALDVNANETESLISTAAVLAEDVLSYYNTSSKSFGQEYEPWQTAAVWDALVQYWWITGDSRYNSRAQEGLLSPVGKGGNLTGDLDDKTKLQYAHAYLSAAERLFPSNPSTPPWYNLSVQIHDADFGYLKPMPTTTLLSSYLLSARVAVYSLRGSISATLRDKEVTTQARGLVDQTFVVHSPDPADTKPNNTVFPEGRCTASACSTEVGNTITRTADVGIYLHTVGIFYNLTRGQSAKQRDRVENALFANEPFTLARPRFNQSLLVLTEASCEFALSPRFACNSSHRQGKSVLARGLAMTAYYAPFLVPDVVPLLRGSVVGMGRACTGPDGRCGQSWRVGEFDGYAGLGEAVDALEVVLALLAVDGGEKTIYNAETAAAALANTTEAGKKSAAGGVRLGRECLGAMLIGILFGYMFLGVL